VLNPFTKVLANQIKPALITNEKRPSVNKLIGKVKITSIGLIKTFNIPSINDKTSAV